MKLTSVLTPLNAENAQLAVQSGVEGAVVRYPGSTLKDVRFARTTAEDYGLELLAIKGFRQAASSSELPHWESTPSVRLSSAQHISCHG